MTPRTTLVSQGVVGVQVKIGISSLADRRFSAVPDHRSTSTFTRTFEHRRAPPGRGPSLFEAIFRQPHCLLGVALFWMSRCPTVPPSTGRGRIRHLPIAANFRHCTTQCVLMVIERIQRPPRESPPEDTPRQESPPDSRHIPAILFMSSWILVLRTQKGFYPNKPRRVPPYNGDLQASGKRLSLLE